MDMTNDSERLFAGEAVEYLMGRYRLTREEAFDVVHLTSPNSEERNKKIYLRSDIDKTYEREYGLL